MCGASRGFWKAQTHERTAMCGASRAAKHVSEAPTTPHSTVTRSMCEDPWVNPLWAINSWRDAGRIVCMAHGIPPCPVEEACASSADQTEAHLRLQGSWTSHALQFWHVVAQAGQYVDSHGLPVDKFRLSATLNTNYY